VTGGDPLRSELPAALIAAYRAAEYRVSGVTPSFVLRVDVGSEPLAALHRARGVACSAFLTACNPGSRPLPAAANADAQQRLEAVLRDAGLDCIAALGTDPAGDWPGEASLLVPGLEREAAVRIAQQYGQNALVHAGTDATPRLVLLR
jgi:hypothetical protein